MTNKDGSSYQVNTMAIDAKNEDNEDGYDVRCGYGNCKPEVLQKCNNPKLLLVLLCIFAFSQGFVVNGINNVNTQSVERRFRLPSSRSGLISSSYDFAAAIFGVIISFVASGRYKARWLTGATFVMGLGSLTMAIPHFTTGLYEWGQDVSSKTCNLGLNSTEDAICERSGLRHYLGMLILGMIFHGIGGCIMYTVGVGLLDDSVNEVRSPLYLGFFYGAAALGPGLGYIVGGQFLNIYVDFDKIDTSTINLKTDDPRWVGAWWAGFFITMALCWLLAVPFSLFGAEMPSAKKVRQSRVSQMHKANADTSGGHGSNKSLPIKMFPKVTWALIQNPPFLFTMLAGASEGILTSGFATFVPKYIQNQFGVSSGSAALYTGAAAVPGAAGGMFFGGLICNRMKLKVKGMLRFAIVTCLLTLISVNMLWISCEDSKFAGVNTPYESGGQADSVDSTCNKDCACTTRYFDPVCSSNGVQYFSACYAGCQNMSEDGDNEVFSDCSCISNSTVTMKSGTCESGCTLLYLFLVLFFITIFLTFVPSTPSDAATLRCIHEDHRTFSMGLKWMFIRLLGTVPGPVIFGAVTDTACLVWQDECGEPSSCWIYDNGVVSRNYFLIAMGAKGLSITFFALAYCLYKPPKEDKFEIQTRESAKRQMAFVNGSFRESEFENNVQLSDGTMNSDGVTDKMTNL